MVKHKMNMKILLQFHEQHYQKNLFIEVQNLDSYLAVTQYNDRFHSIFKVIQTLKIDHSY